MPAAPSFALTRWYASQTTHLEISNGLSFGFGSLIGSSHLAVVGRQANLNNPPASLHPYYQDSWLLPGGPPLCLAWVLYPSQFQLLGGLPWTVGRVAPRGRPPRSRRQVVGVGIPLSGHPRRGSRRAELRHRALALSRDGHAQRCVGVIDTCPWEPSLFQARHALPGRLGFLTAPPQSPLPGPQDLVTKPLERW